MQRPHGEGAADGQEVVVDLRALPEVVVLPLLRIWLSAIPSGPRSESWWLSASEQAAVVAWWGALSKTDAAELADQWAERQSEESLSGQPLLARGVLTWEELRERREEKKMWDQDYQEYWRAHPEKFWTHLGWLDVVTPIWHRFRQFDPSGEQVIPLPIRPLAWSRRGMRYR
ncbi:MAG: hypothetical protein ACI8S6_003204 [Myxococcota bacterium]